MKNFHRTLRISATVGFILALCCLACTVYAKDDGKDKDRNHGIGYEAHINYPVFEKETILNTQVSDVVRKALEAFNSEFFSAEASAYPQSAAFDIDSGSVYEDATHISFLLTVYQYIGGAAHGTTTLIPITYSKQTKKLLSLEEALQPTKKDWLAALSTEARKQLKDQVQKKTLTSDEDWINLHKKILKSLSLKKIPSALSSVSIKLDRIPPVCRKSLCPARYLSRFL